MTLRKIVEIDQERCDGCGQCVLACAEGAIEIVGGKARLARDIYCDGLGACLGRCPQDAITIVEREAAAFDEEQTQARLARLETPSPGPSGGCPGMATRRIERGTRAIGGGPRVSALSTWPVQLRLLSPKAPYLEGADLLLAADCTAFAHGDFHRHFLAGRVPVVACPKLDDPTGYADKLAEIIGSGRIKSLTIVHMEVPCCSGLTAMAREALDRSGTGLAAADVTIGINGDVIAEKELRSPAPAGRAGAGGTRENNSQQDKETADVLLSM